MPRFYTVRLNWAGDKIGLKNITIWTIEQNTLAIKGSVINGGKIGVYIYKEKYVISSIQKDLTMHANDW